MILFLRVFFSLVLVSMLAVTSWASWHCPLFGVPREVATHPWFIATLFDAYWGFLTFYVWVFYQNRSWITRLTWLLAILLLGNIAMAAYCLSATFRADHQAPLSSLLTQKNDRVSPLGLSLAALGIIVIAFAAAA